MYTQKVINNSADSAVLYQTEWLVEKTVRFRSLKICKGAVLRAPSGKFLTLSVDGIGAEIRPGSYHGDVVLSVTSSYTMSPHGLTKGCQIGRELHAAMIVKDGCVVAEQSVQALLDGGCLTEGDADGLYLASTEESFNGIVVTGDGEYHIRNTDADFEGDADNDFLGVGAVVTAIDNSKVFIENCNFTLSGATRCAIHAGGDSQVTVRNCRITNISRKTDRLGSFSWQIGLEGSHRLLQLADNANVTYENCDLKSNGWGICSIDGTWESIRMVIRNCRLEQTGPRSHGYGAFCIGENEVIMEGCRVNVTGYPLMLMGMEGLGHAVIRDCDIRGKRFGVFVAGDDNSVLDISNSRFHTAKSTLCIKGSSTRINIDRSEMRPGNGTIIQLMDTEESGMNVTDFFVPVGKKDVPVQGRSLHSISETEDVLVNFSNSSLRGNIYNSTTNIRAYRNNVFGEKCDFLETVLGVDNDPAKAITGDSIGSRVVERHNGQDLKGPKNLYIHFENTKLEGVISSASQAYRGGLLRITEKNRRELSNVTQAAAPAVNNGVVVVLENNSSWVVTGKSYVTSISFDSAEALAAPDGKKPIMTVDGKMVDIVPGTYTGRIEIYPE